MHERAQNSFLGFNPKQLLSLGNQRGRWTRLEKCSGNSYPHEVDTGSEDIKAARMDTDPLDDIEQLILALLHKQGKDYLPIKQIVARLPVAPRRRLALSTAQPSATLLHKLSPYLGKRLQVYKSSKSTYIGHNLPLEELIVRCIQQKPGVSTKQLGIQLPITKQPYIATLNRLFKSGAVVCTLRENHTLCLSMAAAHAPLAVPTPTEPGDDRLAFKEAYTKVGQGRDFVRIHRLRTTLGWPRAHFDRVLRELMVDYAVELHAGDPSLFTDTDLSDSFTDEHGTLYLTLSWRGQP
jgi:hypothetical protein